MGAIVGLRERTLRIVWGGNTMPLKPYFEELKIGGKAIKMNACDKYGQYFRTAEHISIRPGSDRDKVEALFGSDLVKNSPVVVKV